MSTIDGANRIPGLSGDDEELLFSVLTNLIIFLIIALVFLIVRRYFKWCYEPMTQKRVAGELVIEQPSRGFFGWIGDTLRVSDDEIFDKRGLDALMYLKTIRYSIVMYLGFAIYGLLVLFPVHGTGRGGKEGADILTTGNLVEGSDRYAADLIGTYWNSIIASILLYKLYREYYALRTLYKDRPDMPANYTVMVRELPKGTTEQQVRDHFENVFPGKVWAVHLGYKTKELWEARDDREKYLRKWEHFEAKQLKDGKTKYKHTKGPCCGPKVPAIEYYKDKFEVEDEQWRLGRQRDDHESANVAFVTFTDMKVAQIASQLVWKQYPYAHPLQEKWMVEPAVAPNTVNWRYLHFSYTARALLTLLVGVITFFLIFFWFIPVAFVSGLSTLENLARIPGFGAFLVPLLEFSPVVKGFIEGFLPGLALIIFNAILVSLVLTPLTKLQFPHDISDLWNKVMNKYYLFLLFNTFLGVVFAAGVFEVLEELIESPLRAPELLAEALPGQVNFFINYVLALGMVYQMVQLLQPGRLIIGLFKRRFTAHSKREIRDVGPPFFFKYHVMYAKTLIVFIIVVTFSTLAPLIVPFGLIYMCIAYFVGKYHLQYVAAIEYRGEGRLFPSVFTRLGVSLIVYQLLVAGVMGAGEWVAAAAMIPLIVAQIAFIWLTHRQMREKAYYGGLYAKNAEEEAKVDVDDLPEEDKLPHPDTYKYYTLKEPIMHKEDQTPGVHVPYPPRPEWHRPEEWVTAEDAAERGFDFNTSLEDVLRGKSASRNTNNKKGKGEKYHAMEREFERTGISISDSVNASREPSRTVVDIGPEFDKAQEDDLRRD